MRGSPGLNTSGLSLADAGVIPRFTKATIRLLATPVLLAILIPSTYLVVWAVAGTDVRGFLGEPSLRWFTQVASDDGWRAAGGRSVLLAFSASLTGALLNAVYNYRSYFCSVTARRWTGRVMIAVLLTPLIPYGLAVRSVGTALGIGELLRLLLSHVLIVLPIQFLVFEAARPLLPRARLEAALVSGANHVRTFLTVYAPGVVVGFSSAVLMGVFVSFDEVVVALLNVDSSRLTMPLKLWNAVDMTATPEPAVVACGLMIASAAAAAVISGAPLSFARQLIGVASTVQSLWTAFAVAVASSLATFWLLPMAPALDSLPTRLFLSAVASVASGAAMVAFRARPAVSAVWRANTDNKRSRHAIGTALVNDMVPRAVSRVGRITGGSAIVLPRDDVAGLAEVCFMAMRGTYVGTDRHVPSQYYQRYPSYIGAQAGGREVRSDLRVVLYGPSELEADCISAPSAVRGFRRDNLARGCALLSVPFARANALAQQLQLPSPDLGRFGGDYALFLKPNRHDLGAEATLVSLIEDTEMADRISKFLAELVRVADDVYPADHLLGIRPLDAAAQQARLDQIEVAARRM